MNTGDYVAYGYVVLAVTGAISAPLAKAFPDQKWLATVAKIAMTLGPHWGVVAAIMNRGGHTPPPDAGSGPNLGPGGGE